MMNGFEYAGMDMVLASSFRAAIYCRLSKDDDLDGESASIANQRAMLETYCEKQGWEVVAVYQDDGYTGLNMERPDLKRMLKAIERRQINLVVTKDLSRLGRNYLQTGFLIEDFFPRNGVRYIAMNDGIDTMRDNNDIAPFKNILKNISHSGKVSNDFSLFRRFCCINRCFRCSCGKFSIVHGVQAAIGFQAVAIGEKGDLPETHPVQPRTESKRPCRLTRAKPASKGSDRALSV